MKKIETTDPVKQSTAVDRADRRGPITCRTFRSWVLRYEISWGRITITQGTLPNMWKWRVMVGKPEMLRMGEANDQMRAELQVHHVIDRSLKLQEQLGKSHSTNKQGEVKRPLSG